MNHQKFLLKSSKKSDFRKIEIKYQNQSENHVSSYKLKAYKILHITQLIAVRNLLPLQSYASSKSFGDFWDTLYCTPVL